MCLHAFVYVWRHESSAYFSFFISYFHSIKMLSMPGWETFVLVLVRHDSRFHSFQLCFHQGPKYSIISLRFSNISTGVVLIEELILEDGACATVWIYCPKFCSVKSYRLLGGESKGLNLYLTEVTGSKYATVLVLEVINEHINTDSTLPE